MSVPGSHDPQQQRHRQQLQRALERVHAELAAAPRMDSGSRTLLREVLVDIERALGATAPNHPRVTGRGIEANLPGNAEPAGAGSRSGGAHASRLEAMAVEFEAQHPGIAGSLRQLIDLLGRVGL